MSEQIRLIQKEDIPAVLQIYVPYVLHTPVTFEYDVPTLAEFEQRVAAITAWFPWLVYEVDGIVAGYAYASPHYARKAYQWNAELSVYLSPDYQGRHFATALYTALLSLLREQGYKTLYALITLPNEKSIGLHQTFGFETAGTLQKTGYKFGKWVDVTTLSLQIAAYEDCPSPPKPISALSPAVIQAILIAIR